MRASSTRSRRLSMRSSRGGARAVPKRFLNAAAGLSAAASLLAAAPAPTGHEDTLRRDLNRIFHAPAMAQGLWGVEIKSLDSGEVLYSLNARTLMMPASNMKILTLAAA